MNKGKLITALVSLVVFSIIIYVVFSIRKERMIKKFQILNEEYPSINIEDSLRVVVWGIHNPTWLRNNPHVVHLRTSNGQFVIGADTEINTGKYISDILTKGDTLTKKAGVDSLLVKSRDGNDTYSFKIYPQK